jgi:carboxypeptidase family protein
MGVPNAAPVAGARLEIKAPSGRKVATVESDSAGRYSLQLPPGTYLVTVISPTGAFNRPNPPATVVIKAGEVTHFDIRLDTGIR